MTTNITYAPKDFDLSGLNGISDHTLEVHFGLYEGYVKETNLLNEQLAEMIKNGKIEEKNELAHSELTRRLGFEYNGMVLHEYYFGNLTRNGAGQPEGKSNFFRAAEESFGSYEDWKTNFTTVGMMRGVGWAICYQDPANGRLSNHWIELHQDGNIAGFSPIVVMDVWEHAFMLDYKPAERPKYIEAFFSNIDWNVVENRLQTGKRIAAPASR